MARRSKTETLCVDVLSVDASINDLLKRRWFLGEALPAVLVITILGPGTGSTSVITLVLTRIVIGVQVAIAGYQLLAKYQLLRWKEIALCWLPI